MLAVAVGIYLPLELSTPIFAGGLIAELATRWHRRRSPGGDPEEMALWRLDRVWQSPNSASIPVTCGIRPIPGRDDIRAPQRSNASLQNRRSGENLAT